MIRHLKKGVKILSDSFWDVLFRYRKLYPLLKYYPKGRNHIYDILIEEGANIDFVVFDVGANAGQSALYYNKMLKNSIIYSYEPVSETFSLLVKNIRNLKNVFPYNYALGSREEKVEICLNSQSLNNSLLEEAYSKTDSSLRETVEVKTLDSFASSVKIDKIDILKIDTEGYDLEVLKGAAALLGKNKIKYVFCEVGFNNEKDKVNFCEINNFLKPFMYKLCGFYDTYRVGKNFTFICYMNALFKHIEE